MPTSVLALKVGIGALALGGTAASVAIGVFTTTLTHPTTPKKPNSVVVVNAQAGALTSSTSLTVGSTDKNYKCRLLGEQIVGVACNLVKLNIANNWIDLGGIKKATQTQQITSAELNSSDNYFRLDVEASLFDKIKLDGQKTIELVSTDEKPASLGKLDALFKLNGSAVEYEQTNYLLGKAASDTDSVTVSQNYQCSTTELTASDTSKACQFYAFGSSTASLTGAGYSNQAPTSLPGAAVSAALAADKYYLIKYTAEQAKAVVGDNHKVKIYLPKTSSITQKSSFNNVVPVILHGTTSAQKAFILSETPSFSAVVKKTTAIAGPKTLTHNSTQKNYQCSLASASSVVSNCTLVPLSFSSDKTSFTVSDVKAATTSGSLTIDSTTPPPTYYKLEVEESLFSQFSSGTISSKSIQIIEKPATGASVTVLLTLNPLFAIDDNDAVDFDKSNFIISGSAQSGSVALTSGKDRWCSFSTTDAADSNPKQCHITDLGTAITASQDFKQATEASAVVNANTYLVHYTEASHTGGVPKSEKATGSKFFLQQTSTADSGADSKTDVSNFPLNKVDPVILVEGATSDSKYAFILK